MHRFAVAAVGLWFLPVYTALGSTWFETGPEVVLGPTTGQMTVGVGPLTAINGALAGVGFDLADMYTVRSDRELQRLTGAPGWDAAFLFDSSYHGVAPQQRRPRARTTTGAPVPLQTNSLSLDLDPLSCPDCRSGRTSQHIRARPRWAGRRRGAANWTPAINGTWPASLPHRRGLPFPTSALLLVGVGMLGAQRAADGAVGRAPAGHALSATRDMPTTQRITNHLLTVRQRRDTGCLHARDPGAAAVGSATAGARPCLSRPAPPGERLHGDAGLESGAGLMNRPRRTDQRRRVDSTAFGKSP